MKKSSALVMKLITGAFLGAAISMSAANATTVTDNFAFYGAGNTVLAEGSFSYSSALAGNTLGYTDLSGFNITVFGQSYDLAFVNSLVGDSNNYVYFGFDTATNKFVPAAVPGYAGPFSGILAGISYSPNAGFFIDPMPGQADPAGTGADGGVTAYNPVVFEVAIAGAIPEPSTWAMMLLGFAALGFLTYRRKSLLSV